MGPQFRRKHLAVCVTAVLLCCVCADEKKEVVKAQEGGTVTLQADRTTSSEKVQVVWTYGPENANVRIATVKKKTDLKLDFEDRFRDRLQLDSQTGALTITQLRLNDSGLYTYQSIGSNVFTQTFDLTVYSSVHPPSIKLNATPMNNSCSCSSATVECFVENSRELVLSWYKGSHRLEQKSSSNLSSRLSLTLEIESYDGDDYSCVAKNPMEEKSTKLQTEGTCLRNRENSSWCENEATIRLAISAVVGLVLIVLLVDHVRLRR